VKMEMLVLMIAIISIAVLGSAMAYNTAMGQRDAIEAALQDIIIMRDAEIVRLQEELVQEMTPRSYSLPLEQLWVSSGTGYRVDPMGGATEALHKGVDLVGRVGEPIRAVLAGIVTEHWLVPGWHYGKEYFGHPVFGATIVIDHGDGLYSIYGHLSATFIHEGDWIEMGQVIGELGNTGISTGPHLHLEIVVNPLRYLEER